MEKAEARGRGAESSIYGEENGKLVTRQQSDDC